METMGDHPGGSAAVEGERALAARCASGDREAQRVLFGEQRDRVHRTLYRIMGSNRHMEDLAQDAFVEVFRSIGSFRGESTLATWVDTIAARVAYRHLRARVERPAHLEVVQAVPDAGEAADQSAQAREAARRLYAILDRLEPRYRIAYALGVIDDRPAAEVARITRVSVVAAKNRIWRARRMVDERARRDPWLTQYMGGEKS